MQAYRDRDAILLELGYASYQNYLGSNLWKKIRKSVLMNNPLCICRKKASQIHHRNYARETMTGEDTTALVPVCGRCHRKIETRKSGEKRMFDEAQKVCNDMLSRPPREKPNVHQGQRPVKAQHHTRKVCIRCGNKPMQGARYCRPCYRFTRTGQEHFDSIHLPMCQGRGCIHQAVKGKRYCRIHETDPTLSLKEYQEFQRRARKSGLRVRL